jgi:hypothetical protein
VPSRSTASRVRPTKEDADESAANAQSHANREIVAQLAVGDSLLWVEDESPENHNFSPGTLEV